MCVCGREFCVRERGLCVWKEELCVENGDLRVCVCVGGRDRAVFV